MKKAIASLSATVLALSIGANSAFAETASAASSQKTVTKAQYLSVYNKLQKLMKQQKVTDKNLGTFDELDYVVFTGQQWERLHESHSKDIVVHWPDGRTTTGIDAHVQDLKYMFSFAPDTSIKEHPIRIGSGNKTAVMGTMEGTFSKPMVLADGTVIQPTGKKFKLNMVTIGIWNAQGLMSEEYLFWDNQAFMKQIGLAN